MYRLTLLFLLFSLISSQLLNAQAPSNDLCVDAIPIACGQTLSGNLSNATPTPQSSPACINGRDDLWYTYVGDGNAIRITVTSANGVDVPGLGILIGETCAEATCLNRLDGSMGNITFGNIPTVAGERYYFTVNEDAFSDPQAFNIRLECLGPMDTPTNDICANATFLPIEGTSYDNPITVNTLAANIEAGSRGTNCGGSERDVWFKVVRPANGRFILELRSIANSSASRMQAALYQTCSFQLFQCENERFGISPGIMEFDVQNPDLDTILIRVMSSLGTVSPGDGEFFLDAYFDGLVPNSTCATAENFTVEEQENCTPQPLQLGFSQPYEVPCTAGLSLNTEWFNLTSPAGFRAIEINQDQADQYITILDACNGQVLACEQTESLRLNVDPGTPLVMAVSVSTGDTLTTNLCVSGLDALVTNNTSANAINLTIDTTCTLETFTMGTAVLSNGVASCATDMRASQDVFYSFESEGEGARIQFIPNTDTTTYELELLSPSGNVAACISTIGSSVDTLVEGLAVGEMYNLRIVSSSSDSDQQYELCVEQDGVSSIYDPKQLAQIDIYPNPASTSLRFISDAIGRPYSVINAQGQVVANGRITNTQMELDIQDLAAGIYVLHVGSVGAGVFIIE